MFWTFLILWIISTVICWVSYTFANEWGADWVIVLEDYGGDGLYVVLLTVPIINTLFLIFLVISTIWKLLRMSIFNRNFYKSIPKIIREIWKS